MKNLITRVFCSCAVLATLSVCAMPPPPRGGGPRHHHHHHHDAAVAAGILGAGIVGAAVIEAATRPAPVVVTQPAVVAAPAPVVVAQPTVVTTGHYETRVQNVWVEGRYIDQATTAGTVVRTWQPGHYEQRTTQVWVP